jgi:hypothetical protein
MTPNSLFGTASSMQRQSQMTKAIFSRESVALPIKVNPKAGNEYY